MPSIELLLVVKDNDTVLAKQVRPLAQQGFGLHKATSEAQALKLARQLRPDLVLIDLLLSEENSAIGLCQRIRKEDRDAFIIMVARNDATEQEKIKAYDAGADDCVSEPFSPKELTAKSKAWLRRSSALPGTRDRILEFGDLWLDTKNYVVYIKGEPVYLRPMEFKLLAALASKPGELKTREELTEEVWEQAYVPSSRTVHVHIRRIRRLLAGKSEFEYIHTQRGLGYRFEVRPRTNHDLELAGLASKVETAYQPTAAVSNG